MNFIIKKYLKQKLELIHYTDYLLRVDKKFRIAIAISVLILLVSISKLLFEINAYAIIGIITSISGLLFSFLKIRKYGSGDTKSEIYAEAQDSIIIRDKVVLFKNFKPSVNEVKQGFYTLDPGYNSEEFAVTGDNINRWLILEQPNIPFSVGPDMSYTYCNKKNIDGNIGIEKFKAQLKYLHNKIFKKSLTTNDRKFSITSEFTQNCDKVTLSKVGYYDALVTNEAFRSILFQRPYGAKLTHNNNIVYDLRKHFPFDDIDSDIHLKELQSNIVAGHVGVSTLAISKDSYPIFFQQARWNDQMAGKLVVSGSGSVDFSDIGNSQSDSFLDILKYSMARELSQEGSLSTCEINKIANNTLIIGYFRWVDRSGKPEFLGLTKLDKTKEEIKADYEEVLPVSSSASNRKIIKVTDLSIMCEEIKSEVKENKISVGLSSAMVLFRLEQIALNGKGHHELKKISNFLFSDNC